jgi:protein TonB
MLVALLHAGALLALAAWVPATPATLEAPPIQVALMETEPPDPDPWQAPVPALAPMTVSLVEPEIVVPDLETDAAITLPPNPQPAAPASPGPVFTPKVISEVAYLQPPAPRYPAESRRSRERGLVVVRALVDEEGRAREVSVQQSSGYPRLDKAACQAVERARFKPYVEEGVARPAIAVIPIEFGLTGSSTAQNRSSRG